MGMESIKDGKLLYHLTRLDNLDSILQNGLIPRKYVKEFNLTFMDIADNKIISKRNEMGLDEYTPFHFHPYSSFDVAVKNDNADKEFIYICIRRELAKKNNFMILPRHPLNVSEFKLYDYDEGFNIIDWDTMHTLGTDDRYSKNVKMAECLINKRIDPIYFHCIYVRNNEIKKKVESQLKSNGINKKPPFVDVAKWL